MMNDPDPCSLMSPKRICSQHTSNPSRVPSTAPDADIIHPSNRKMRFSNPAVGTQVVERDHVLFLFEHEHGECADNIKRGHYQE